MTSETDPSKVVVRQFGQGNNGIIVGDDPVLDTTSSERHLVMQRGVKERKLH
jgi:hypothetical protein